MHSSRTFLAAFVCVPLLGACAGTKDYMARAEAGRGSCSSMEGYPDCVDGHLVNLVAYEPGIDRTSIQDLQARYESAVGAGDPGALAALFTDDAVVEGPAGIARGRAAIRDELTRPGATSAIMKAPHVVTNAVISLDGLRATSTASWLELDKGSSGAHPTVGRFGRYEDQFIKSGSSWFFVKRKIVVS
jgi:ketosteroid isomerase-like protein